MEHLRGVAEGHVDRLQLGLAAVVARGSGACDEEVQQHRLDPAARHQHVAARAEPRQQRLG